MSPQRLANGTLLAREQLARIVQATTNIVVLTDPQRRIVWVNAAFERLTGFTLDEIRGKTPGSFLQCKRTSAEAVQTMREALLQERGCRVELINRSKSGREYIVELEIQPLRDEHGTLTGFMSIENDITDRVRDREQIERQDALLKETNAVAQIGGWEVDLEAGVTHWTDETRRIHGVPPGYVPTLDEAINFYAPEARPVIRAAVESGIADGTPWDLELPFITKQGDRRWVRALGRAIRRHGKTVRIYGAFQDITQQRSISEVQRCAEERLKSLLDGSDLMAWEFCLEDDRFTVASFHGSRHGYPNEMWLKPGFWDSILHPEDRERCTNECMGEIAAGRAHRLHYRVICADGSVAWVSDYVSAPYKERGQTILRGVAADVTEMTRNRLALREHAERIDLTVRSANLGTWDWNILDGTVCFNDVAQTMLGYAPGEWEPHVRAWERVLHPDDKDRVMADLMNHVEGRCPEYRTECRLRCKDGSYTWILDVGRVTERDEYGNARRAMGIHMDITASRKAADELREARTLADAANLAKSEFLANMSHEIRTPLTAIIGYADILREEGDLSLAPAARLQSLQTIRTAGQHLLTIINDVLDLSKIEAGRMRVEELEVDLHEIVRDALSIITPRLKDRNVALSTRLEGDVPDRIVSDPTRLRQMLLNIMGNAAKFTDRGSITISLIAQGSSLHIDVEDTGPGLTPEQRARLFQPFSQGDSTLTRTHGGSGLGLALCRRVSALMGGSVTLPWSEPGKGSRFRISLPLVPARGAGRFSPDALQGPAPRQVAGPLPTLHGRILLVEDGLENQRLISHHLRKAGATVDLASDGAEGLDKIAASIKAGMPYDLVLSDMQMPVMDGYTLARTLREKGNQTPIIALTAHAMCDDRDKCLASGCDDYATKPIDRAALLATCAKWMGMGAQRAAA